MMCAGFTAGFASVVLTMPFDVVKTRMQVGGGRARRVSYRRSQFVSACMCMCMCMCMCLRIACVRAPAFIGVAGHRGCGAVQQHVELRHHYSRQGRQGSTLRSHCLHAAATTVWRLVDGVARVAGVLTLWSGMLARLPRVAFGQSIALSSYDVFFGILDKAF
jgi:hypothetical protein